MDHNNFYCEHSLLVKLYEVEIGYGVESIIIINQPPLHSSPEVHYGGHTYGVIDISNPNVGERE